MTNMFVMHRLDVCLLRCHVMMLMLLMLVPLMLRMMMRVVHANYIFINSG